MIRAIMWCFRAKFTAGSLVHVEDTEGRVLLVRQRIRNRNQWGLPGGFHKRREDASYAALREVREETGVDTSATLVFRMQYRQSNRNHYDHLFTSMVKSSTNHLGPKRLLARLEIAEVAWFDVRNSEDCPPLNYETQVALAKLDLIPGYEVG